MRSRVARSLNDLDYYQASPLGWKHGTIIVWAGMRGVVTLAAAQTLPRDTPERELLILIAFFVAVGSLLLQGLTIPWVIRMLKMPASGDSVLQKAESDRLQSELDEAVTERLADPGLRRTSGEAYDPDLLARLALRTATPADDDLSAVFRELRIAMIEAMRARLIEVTHEGSFSSAVVAARSGATRRRADQHRIAGRRGLI